MRLLMFYAETFAWEPGQPSIPQAEAEPAAGSAAGALVAFIHAEEVDGDRPGWSVTRAIKQIKWLAGKFHTREVVLHYFSHLAAERSPPELARELVEAMAARLRTAGYGVRITPFGHVCRWSMTVPEDSLGRVFVEIVPPRGERGEEEGA
jgi:hypothetical protein